MQHRNTSLYQAGLCIKPYESQGILFDHVYKAHNACKYSQVIQLWCSEILTLLESKSTSQTSSGSLKLFLYGRKLAGTPMMNGVGAKSSCKIKQNKLPTNTCTGYIMFSTSFTRSRNSTHHKTFVSRQNVFWGFMQLFTYIVINLQEFSKLMCL